MPASRKLSLIALWISLSLFSAPLIAGEALVNIDTDIIDATLIITLLFSGSTLALCSWLLIREPHPHNPLHFNTRRYVTISLIGFLAMLLLVSRLAWVALDYNKQHTLESIRTSLETVLASSSENLELWAEGRIELLQHIVNRPELLPLVEQLLALPADQTTLLASQELSRVREYFDNHHLAGSLGFFIIRPDSLSIGSMRDSNVGTPNLIASSHPQLLQRAFAGESLLIPPIPSDVPLNNIYGDTTPTMFVIAPLKDRHGNIIATITQRLSPEHEFSRLIQLGQLGISGETYAFDRSGLMLSNSRFHDQLRDVGLLPSDENAPLHIMLRDPGRNLLNTPYQQTDSPAEWPLTEMAAKATSGKSGINLQGYRDYRGVEVLGTWHWNEKLGLGLATEIDRSEILDGYYVLRVTLLSVLGIAMLLSIGAMVITLLTGVRANQTLLLNSQALEKEVKQRTQTLQDTVEQLKQTQSQLIQSEKLASIGQLAAGVAHEINNPVGFVSSNVHTLKEYSHDLLILIDEYQALLEQHPELDHNTIETLLSKLDYDYLKNDIVALIDESEDGLLRVKKIVDDLRNFSRDGKEEWQETDLHKELDSTLNIVRNELKYKAEVIKEYGNLPLVKCLPAQLNQVFMNLLVNAGQAIEEQGTIHIRTGTLLNQVWVEIRDSGKGIKQEELSSIFDPFYTTKPVGKGTGLGLSVSYGIIQKHHGHIDVHSTPGEGTSMRIRIPIAREAQPEEAVSVVHLEPL